MPVGLSAWQLVIVLNNTFEVFPHENTFELDSWITGSWSQALGSESMAWLRTLPGMAGLGVFTSLE